MLSDESVGPPHSIYYQTAHLQISGLLPTYLERISRASRHGASSHGSACASSDELLLHCNLIITSEMVTITLLTDGDFIFLLLRKLFMGTLSTLVFFLLLFKVHFVMQ